MEYIRQSEAVIDINKQNKNPFEPPLDLKFSHTLCLIYIKLKFNYQNRIYLYKSWPKYGILSLILITTEWRRWLDDLIMWQTETSFHGPG